MTKEERQQAIQEVLAKVEDAAKLQSSCYFHEIHRGNIDMARALVDLARLVAADSA